jgi:choline dehydrogenase-like flavoprotein
MQRLKTPMRRYAENEMVDYLIVGIGSAGGVLIQRLARAGFSVVGLEAGPFWDTERDWVSDEAGSHKLYWDDLRITGGENPVTLGANNSGKGVGGGSVHWAGFAPLFSSFRLSRLFRRWSRCRLANYLPGSKALLRAART